MAVRGFPTNPIPLLTYRNFLASNVYQRLCPDVKPENEKNVYISFPECVYKNIDV